MNKVKSGDIFLLAGSGWLDKIINFFQALYSGDKRSQFTHSGIFILDGMGYTFETTYWRTGQHNLLEEHPGSHIKILRWKGMNLPRVLEGFEAVKDQGGRIYPYHRLALFALGLARWIHWKGMVCSEIVACFLAAAGAREGYWGINVDQLNDDTDINPEWKVVYEGKPREM